MLYQSSSISYMWLTCFVALWFLLAWKYLLGLMPVNSWPLMSRCWLAGSVLSLIITTRRTLTTTRRTPQTCCRPLHTSSKRWNLKFVYHQICFIYLFRYKLLFYSFIGNQTYLLNFSKHSFITELEDAGCSSAFIYTLLDISLTRLLNASKYAAGS